MNLTKNQKNCFFGDSALRRIYISRERNNIFLNDFPEIHQILASKTYIKASRIGGHRWSGVSRGLYVMTVISLIGSL
jgi:hypothetical protein